MTPATPKRKSIFADKLAAFAEFVSVDNAASARRGQWRAFFRDRVGSSFDGQIVFEIGCADAASLCAMAAKHPTTGFIGLDWKYKQIYVGAEQIASIGLRNVALLRARAQGVRQIFADSEIDEMLVFHPEPCDRPEERNNRLLNESFLIDAHHVLRDAESTISLKTDHVGYYQWMLGQFGLPEPDWTIVGPTRIRARDLLPREQVPSASATLRDHFAIATNSRDFWNDPIALAYTAGRCFADEVTTFERRFVKKRQPIFYLELRKQNQADRASTSR